MKKNLNDVPGHRLRIVLPGIAIVLVAVAAGADESAAVDASAAETSGADTIVAPPIRQQGLKMPSATPARDGESPRMPAMNLAQSNEPAAATGTTAESAVFPEYGARKSYAIPAAEIFGFDVMVNRLNHKFSNSTDYDVSLSSIRNNLHSGWVTDNDPYKVNQFAHPYQGSMYHGFARSAGLSYWESAAYTFAGSAFWEIAGEQTRPSKNDQIASGVAGSFLGEALFRMSSLALERGGDMPSFWRETSAAAISPATGFNRLAFGDRFDSVFSSGGAAYYSRLQLGMSATTRNVQGASTQNTRNDALADYSMEYGLPGVDGYEYTRPFDYFAFQATASSANVIENIQTRGLLLGKSYGEGHGYRGVWGLYGNYDYLSPQTYRISSTALSLGSTAQQWLSQTVALQGTALLGAGYAAVGTLHGAGEGDYHYGVTPQAYLGLRLILDDRAALDVAGREYFVSGIGSTGTGGHDNIARGEVSLTVRVYKQHAIAVKYLWNRRDASYPFLGDRTQENSTVGIFYSYIGHDKFGAIDWRTPKPE